MKKGKRMKVYKLSEEHLEERVSWLNDPRVYEYMNMQFPITFRETKKWYERIADVSSRIDFIFYEEEMPVSMTGLTNINIADGLAELYIIVNPDFQGKGYGQISTQFTINYAFLNHNVQKIILYTNDFNERANNLYGKLGFELEGKLRKHKFRNGHYIDRCLFGLLKEDWEKKDYKRKNLKLEF